MPESVDIYIGLGSNQGNREQLIEKAIELLSVALGAPIQQSTIIETEPWGFESDLQFLNMVACFNCNLQPLELLDLTEKTEKELGRTTKSSGGIYKDRPIDIDILLYGNRVIESKRLTIPHPRLHERLFVLEPLKEISPQLVHPIFQKTIAELTDSIKTDGKEY